MLKYNPKESKTTYIQRKVVAYYIVKKKQQLIEQFKSIHTTSSAR